MTFKAFATLIVAFLVLTTEASRSQQHEMQMGEEEIRQWLDNFTKAFTARDTKAIMALYSPDVTAYDISPPLSYTGSENYRQDYVEFFKPFTGSVGLEIRALHVHVSGDLAVAHGLEHITGPTTDGGAIDMWVRFTTILQKVNGRWLDIHDHISVPTDFATGKSVLDLKP